MKTFVKSLPGNTNVKGSGVGSPSGDMNKIADALVEVRSSVPNVPSDVGAATASQLSDLSNRIIALINRINALKISAISDAFTRNSLGSAYTLVSGASPTFVNNQISQGTAGSFFVANTSTKTFQMYGNITVFATSTTAGHPQVIINYNNGSYYRALYSVTNARWELYKMLSGTENLLGSFPAARPTSTYTLRVYQYQNTITVSSNDSVKIAVTESNPLHGKQAGIMIPSISDTSAPTRVIDDFLYGDWGA